MIVVDIFDDKLLQVTYDLICDAAVYHMMSGIVGLLEISLRDLR